MTELSHTVTEMGPSSNAVFCAKIKERGGRIAFSLLLSRKRIKKQGYRIASRQPLQNFFCSSPNHSARSHAHLLRAAHVCPRPIRSTDSRSHSFFRAHGSHVAFLLNSRAAGVRGPAFARAQEDGGSVGCSDEPEQCVDQINPDNALHANDAALLGCRMGVDVDLAKNAKEGEPQDSMVILSANCCS